MKRGLRCDFVHFSGRPFTGPESIYKAYAHVAQLDRFQGGSRLFVVPFGARAAPDRGGRRRPAPGDRAAAADAARRLGARPARGRRGARHRRLARPGLLPDARTTSPSSRQAADASAAAPARRLGQVGDRPRGAGPRHVRDREPARRGLLHAVREPARRDARARRSSSRGSSRGSTSTRSSPGSSRVPISFARESIVRLPNRRSDGSIPPAIGPFYAPLTRASWSVDGA